jgi:WD40 repeat protein
VSRIAFEPKAERIATIGSDRIVHVWRVRTGALLAQTPALDDATATLTFSDDGRFLLTTGEVGGARVWDTTTGHAATPPLRAGGRLEFAAFRTGGKEVVTVSKSGVACAWELPRGPQVRRRAVGDYVSPSGSGAESRSFRLADGTIVRTTVRSDGTLQPRRPGARVVEQAVLSTDARRVAFCDDATTVVVSGTGEAETATTPLRHRSPVRYAAFSPDGRRILTACEDRTVRLWDAATGDLLAPPMQHALAIQRVIFQENDTHAHVVHDGDVVSIWDLSEDDRPVADLLALAQVIAGGAGEGNRKR